MMALIVSLMLLMACQQISSETYEASVDGTELVLAFMIHRHGDRTPVESSLSLAGDIENIDELIAPWGYGQLTNVGRRRAYELGKFIRRRYDGFLSETYNRSEIYIRSTDSTRTKTTVLTALASIFPAVGDTWSEEINWVPVPYTTVPAKYDFNLAALNCPTFSSVYSSLLYSTSATMARYTDVLTELSGIVGIDLVSYPALTYVVYDVYVSLMSLGVDLSSELNALMPGIQAAAGDAMDIIFGNEDYIKYEAGVLLNEFFEYAAVAIAGNDTQRVRLYSAHDVNVYSFEAVTQTTPRQGQPKYASLYSLELRRVVDTGKYVVLPVYLKSPEESEMYLRIEGCGDSLCDYDTFYNLTSKFALDEDDWRTECGFTEDIVIDSSDID